MRLEKCREPLRLFATARGEREIGPPLHALLSVALAFPMAYEKDVHFAKRPASFMATILLVSKPVEPTWNDSITPARGAALAEYDRERMARAFEALYDAVTRS